MKNSLVIAFGDKIQNCLTATTNSLIEIFDCYDCSPELQKSYIRTSPLQPVHFVLENTGFSNLTFIAIDNCLLGRTDPERCDFAIGNMDKIFFGEIKQVNAGQRRDARIKAISQLHTTIKFFRMKLDPFPRHVFGVICIKAKKVHPVQNAKRISDAVAFKETLNANLIEGHKAVF